MNAHGGRGGAQDLLTWNWGRRTDTWQISLVLSLTCFEKRPVN
jgi:hypothetical protein